MEIEKFYKAQELRKEILELQTILSSVDNALEIKSFEKLNIETQKLLQGKMADVLMRELVKIIKQKELEFNSL